jgi:hypothetical protein
MTARVDAIEALQSRCLDDLVGTMRSGDSWYARTAKATSSSGRVLDTRQDYVSGNIIVHEPRVVMLVDIVILIKTVPRIAIGVMRLCSTRMIGGVINLAGESSTGVRRVTSSITGKQERTGMHGIASSAHTTRSSSTLACRLSIGLARKGEEVGLRYDHDENPSQQSERKKEVRGR